jgi:CelD/BcsL family acetyltransferase involved in cellulose biosynthesis
MSVTAQSYSDTAVFSELAPEWHALLANSRTNHCFQTPEFMSTWWKSLGSGTLEITTFRGDSGELIGLALLFLHEFESAPALSFVGCVDVADYLDFVIHREHQAEVYQAICQYLQSRTGVQLKLCSIPDDSPTRSQLQAFFGEAQAIVTQQDVAPLIQLPESWEAYLESLDRKQRHEIRRKWNRLEREVAHSFSVITDPTLTDQATDVFIALHKASSPGKSRFWDDHHVAFFTDLLKSFAQAGWLRLYFLEVEGKSAATMLVFDYNNRYYLYNSGYDPEYLRHLSTGNTLLAYTIRDAIEQGRAVYDFLRGDEAYKFRFGAAAQPVWDAAVQL